jgi:hypothetical protein
MALMSGLDWFFTFTLGILYFALLFTVCGHLPEGPLGSGPVRFLHPDPVAHRRAPAQQRLAV